MTAQELSYLETALPFSQYQQEEITYVGLRKMVKDNVFKKILADIDAKNNMNGNAENYLTINARRIAKEIRDEGTVFYKGSVDTLQRVGPHAVGNALSHALVDLQERGLLISHESICNGRRARRLIYYGSAAEKLREYLMQETPQSPTQ